MWNKKNYKNEIILIKLQKWYNFDKNTKIFTIIVQGEFRLLNETYFFLSFSFFISAWRIFCTEKENKIVIYIYQGVFAITEFVSEFSIDKSI